MTALVYDGAAMMRRNVRHYADCDTKRQRFVATTDDHKYDLVGLTWTAKSIACQERAALMNQLNDRSLHATHLVSISNSSRVQSYTLLLILFI